MERIREEDGNKLHRNAASYHLGACRRVRTPLHEALATAIRGAYQTLHAGDRAVEDAEDARQQTLAEVEASEVDLENCFRDLDAGLGQLDRADGSLNARRGVFPEGFSAEIKPEGTAQLAVLPGVRKRLQPFQELSGIEALVLQLDTTEAAFRAALTADQQALAAIENRKLDAEAARKVVREQLESAYGQLRAHYKSRPGTAEQFFLRNPRGRKKVSTTKPGTPAGTKPGTPVGTQPGTPVSTQPGTPVGTKSGTPVGTQPGTKLAVPAAQAVMKQA